MRQPTGGGSLPGRLVAGEPRPAAHLQNEGSDGTQQQRDYHPLVISGTEGEKVDNFKYLGMSISWNLSGTQHIGEEGQTVSLPP